jgi:hypothetical protein
VPVAGSAYTYAYATLGELFAWIIGWDLVLEYAVASSTVAHGWSHYLISFLGLFDVTLPAQWIGNPSTSTGRERVGLDRRLHEPARGARRPAGHRRPRRRHPRERRLQRRRW